MTPAIGTRANQAKASREGIERSASDLKRTFDDYKCIVVSWIASAHVRRVHLQMCLRTYVRLDVRMCAYMSVSSVSAHEFKLHAYTY
jgi:hypothetical protein